MTGRAAVGHDGVVLSGRDATFVPLLVLTERLRSAAGVTDAEAADLVVYCLQGGQEWWVEHALNWVEQGVRSQPMVQALADASRDRRLSQSLRHRARRWHRLLTDESQTDRPGDLGS